MRGYERTVSDMIKNAGSGSGGSSSGSGGGFSGGGGFSRRWRSLKGIENYGIIYK